MHKTLKFHGASKKKIFEIELSGLVVKNAKKEKKIFFVLLMINHAYIISKMHILCMFHAYYMHVLTAHHSKAHRGIDFEQLVTGRSTLSEGLEVPLS